MNFLNDKEDKENHVDSQDAPLVSLRPATIQILSSMLNSIKIIPTDAGLPRDWRGLAELSGISSDKISLLESKSDPSQELLKILSKEGVVKSVKDLKAFLAVIDRFDIVDDAESYLESDIELYQERLSLINSNIVEDLESSELLTYDDTITKNRKTRYDAFILYDDADSEFADEVISRLETEYNLKMCVKDRDLLPGVMFEHETIGKLIEERCNRLLVIFSPNFLQSQGNKFLVSFTQALALESRQRKIIPCMYKRCELPLSVRYTFCLDYNRSGKLWNFWDRLSQAISTNSSPPPLPKSQISSTSTSSKLEDSFSWWDSEKNNDKTTNEPSLDSNENDFDSCSIVSSASSQLPLTSTTSTKEKAMKNSKKWYKKILKRKEKGEKYLELAE